MADEQSEGKPAARSESGRPERMPRVRNPLEEMDRMFNSFFPESWRSLRSMRPWSEMTEGLHPRIDIIDRDNEILVRAEIPGVEKEDLDVSVTDNDVTIRGSHHQESKEEEGDYYRCEISHSDFARTVALPSMVDSANASAAFKNGVLELKLPKVEKAKRRSIPVN